MVDWIAGNACDSVRLVKVVFAAIAGVVAKTRATAEDARILITRMFLPFP
jgi:hypothetical protein